MAICKVLRDMTLNGKQMFAVTHYSKILWHQLKISGITLKMNKRSLALSLVNPWNITDAERLQGFKH